MSIFAKALDEIKFKIPIEVLREAFKDDLYNWRQAPVSLDDQIMTKVIKPRVMLDANLVGGQQIIVSLEGLTPNYIDTYTMIYEIPLDYTNFREIMAVLSIGYMPTSTTFNSMGVGMGMVSPRSASDLMSAAQRVGDSVSNIPAISNATVDLIGANTILVRDRTRVTNIYQLRCIVANENNMNNINPRSWLNFSTLCVHAVKSYIYNRLLIAIDRAYLTGGQELGAFKSYVETLSDAEENYQTYLKEVWRPTAFCNDALSYQRLIRLQISPGL